jgi:hypothetical protein
MVTVISVLFDSSYLSQGYEKVTRAGSEPQAPLLGGSADPSAGSDFSFSWILSLDLEISLSLRLAGSTESRESGKAIQQQCLVQRAVR